VPDDEHGLPQSRPASCRMRRGHHVPWVLVDEGSARSARLRRMWRCATGAATVRQRKTVDADASLWLADTRDPSGKA